MKLVPPFGVFDDYMANSSRKRKAIVLDQECSRTFDCDSKPFRGNLRENRMHVPLEESCSQDNVGSLMGIYMRGNNPEALSNQNVQFASWSLNASPQFGNFEFQKDKINNPYMSVKSLKVHDDKLSPLNWRPVREFLPILDWQHARHRAAHDTEANKFQSHVGASNPSIENSDSYGMNLVQSNMFSANSSLTLPHQSLTTLEELQSETLQTDEHIHYEDANTKTCTMDLGKVGSAVEIKLDATCTNTAGSKGFSSVESGGSLQTEVSTEGKEAYGSYPHPKNEVRPGNSTQDATSVLNEKDKDECQLGLIMSPITVPAQSTGCKKICSEAGKLNNSGQMSDGQESKIVDMKGGRNIENAKHLNADSPPKEPSEHGNDASLVLQKLNGKCTPHSGEVASKPIEKLWEGSLQLNTSVTVSAVAYFRSGEKAQEFNWSKHVAVKGKVKLVAFEKYIQELPRSRNRTLMVISLCWKAGSSKAGLMGMKEVAEGYKEGKKVGFAQFAPSIDLYICPRSDTIITILAKYGFFKGLAAVQVDEDSLIGCVVWRRNNPSSDLLSKNYDGKKITFSEKPFDSLPDSAILRGMEKKSPVIAKQDSEAGHGNACILKEAACPFLDMSEMRSATPVSEQNMAAGKQNTQTSKDVLPISVSLTNAIPKLTPLVPDSSPGISVGQSTRQQPDSSSLQDFIVQVSKVEIPLMHNTEPKKHNAGLELSQHNLPEAPQTLLTAQEKSIDDEDLPEFDFSTACGVSQLEVHELQLGGNNVHFSDAPPIDKKVPVEVIRNTFGCVPLAHPIIRLLADTNQQGSSTHQAFGLDTHLGKPAMNKPGDPASHAPVWPISNEKPAIVSCELSSRATAMKLTNPAASPGSSSHILKKNLWDDDDDMPEWCPPDVDATAQQQSRVTSRPSNVSFHKSTLGKLSLEPSGRPQIRSQSQKFSHSPMQPQGFPFVRQPELLAQEAVNNIVMPPQIRPASAFVQLGPRYSTGLNPNLALRPPSSLFEIKLNIRPVGRRGQQF